MEIAEYVRLIARRSRFVAFVAIAAAVAATLLFLTSPRTYVATTTVLVPTPPGSTSLFASVSQSVSDFEAAVSTDGVASQVASDVGLPPDDVAGVVEAERLSGSGVVELRYEHRDPEVAEQVVEGMSREALLLLLEARLEPFAAQLEIAQNQYDDAQADYDGFLNETGFINPEQVFLQEENEAQDLRNQIGAAITAGDDELAAALQERLDEKTARNAPLAAEFQAIQNAQRRTDEALSAAQVANDQALGALESVEEGSSGAISPSDAVAVSRTQTFVRTVVPTIVIATILAIGLVVLLEIVPARRSPIRARLKSRLPLDKRSRSSIVPRLQALAARREEEADMGPVAPVPEPSEDAGVRRPSSQTSGGSGGIRPRERPKKLRLRLDPAEEALAAQEARAVREARAVQEARARAAEEARTKAAEEARVRAVQEARARAAEEARTKAAEEARVRAVQEARVRAAEEARAKAAEAAEEAKRIAAEEASRKAADEAKRKAAEEAKAKAAEEAKRKAADEAKRKAAEEAKAKAAEETKAKAAEEDKAKAAEAKRKVAEEVKPKAREGSPARSDGRASDAGEPDVASQGTGARPAPSVATDGRAQDPPTPGGAAPAKARRSGSGKSRRKKARAARGGASPQGAGDPTSAAETSGAGAESRGDEPAVRDPASTNPSAEPRPASTGPAVVEEADHARNERTPDSAPTRR